MNETVWKKQCTAIDARTGRRCALPVHPKTPHEHRHGRTTFSRVAAPGQTFFEVDAEIERCMTAPIESEVRTVLAKRRKEYQAAKESA